jgi:hypothetical protein
MALHMESTGSGDDYSTVTESPPLDRAQLQGRACRHCGGADGDLIPDGHAYTETQPGRAPLGWAVVAHPTCIKEHA